MRKTKIVCTLGPATYNYQTLKRLVKAGMNVARINMSHGSYEEHAARIEMVRKAREELGQAVAVMLDTKGPEIRVRTFEGGKAYLTARSRAARRILPTATILRSPPRSARATTPAYP